MIKGYLQQSLRSGSGQDFYPDMQLSKKEEKEHMLILFIMNQLMSQQGRGRKTLGELSQSSSDDSDCSEESDDGEGKGRKSKANKLKWLKKK